ncbi:hypothetical protein ASPSYDRAFT_88047 [Aspergillus sydowii CBS 593.65]|uniref:CFEM domain-containing protein n=1 Tax=Aspergillus sydowii CBS 593.65 TaxID=1036612 RepID=A0A1L9TQ01_9EURO|nr:uncharacterized protein ASPSYDRAFT_88047 [Aspergillus sydowii CBS 593.65]OJJ61504.1 hypothetical protein ASPSYDRAFT_88047 [Aspergillus sydowii CBS 593.65]
MKLSAIFAVGLASLAASQSINDVPKCAVPCLQDAVKSETNCGANDFNCACKGDNYKKVQSAATGCVIDACGQDVALEQVAPAVQKLCGK